MFIYFFCQKISIAEVALYGFLPYRSEKQVSPEFFKNVYRILTRKADDMLFFLFFLF